MSPGRSPLAYPGLLGAVIGGTAGAIGAGPEAGLLWLVVGYFLGKTLQSAIRTLSGDTLS
jgi:hypothetical protein